MWSARSTARTNDLDGDLCAGGTSPLGGWPSHWRRCGHPGYVTAGHRSWRRVRGNGGAGSGLRRCAAALGAAGQAACYGETPRRSDASSVVLPGSFHAFRALLAALTTRVRPRPDGPTRRRCALEGEEKNCRRPRAPRQRSYRPLRRWACPAALPSPLASLGPIWGTGRILKRGSRRTSSVVPQSPPGRA
jgi:hypothetical protein